MAKRFATVFFITIGIALACVVVFAMVLFLAPGFSVFGIKYIAKGTHIVTKNATITSPNSIRVEVDEVPIQVVFSQKYAFSVEYYDNYNGLTSSKIDDPSISISEEKDGTTVIKVTSFKKFIYENNNSVRYIKITMPSAAVGGIRQGQNKFTVLSKSSSVTFSKEVTDNYNPKFKNLKIESSGKIKTLTSVATENYELKTINSILITKDETESINAKNYYLTSTGGKIVVQRDVEGDISAKTKNARIQILSCNNFTADSGFGDIYSADKEKGITVNGKANISTTAGVVDIDSILGSVEKSEIQTKTGNVQIKKVYDLNLTTTRGFVKIVSGRNLSVTTSSGSINVESASEAIKAKSKRGKITLGGDNGVLYNATVESTYGDVSVTSASGTTKIDTIKADVLFINNNSSNITINAGGNLTADKLIGAVNVNVEGDATLSFKSFTQKSTIVGKKENSIITINLLNNEIKTFSYNLEGKDAFLIEYNANDPENSRQAEKSTNLTSSIEMVGKPLLTATNVGKLVVNFKSENN